MRGAFAAALCVACGARTELDVGSRDASTPLPCTWTTAFGSVTPIAELDSPSGDAELRLSQDELTGYFYRGADIFVTHRPSMSGQFSTPVVATDVSTSAFDADPFLSADGLALYLNSGRSGTMGESDIFVAMRASPTSPFSPAVPVANVNSTVYDGTPYVTNAGNELWLASSRGGSIHLYRALGNANGFGQAQEVSELNHAGSVDNNPVLTADGLTVYFSSNRSGPTQVYVAHRSTTADPFSSPSVVSEISTSGSDYASWISADACRLYMTRGAGSGFALYVATR